MSRNYRNENSVMSFSIISHTIYYFYLGRDRVPLLNIRCNRTGQNYVHVCKSAVKGAVARVDIDYIVQHMYAGNMHDRSLISSRRHRR